METGWVMPNRERPTQQNFVCRSAANRLGEATGALKVNGEAPNIQHRGGGKPSQPASHAINIYPSANCTGSGQPGNATTNVVTANGPWPPSRAAARREARAASNIDQFKTGDSAAAKRCLCHNDRTDCPASHSEEAQLVMINKAASGPSTDRSRRPSSSWKNDVFTISKDRANRMPNQ